MAKTVISYYESVYHCIATCRPDTSWSFTVYDNGIVELRCYIGSTIKSRYRFKLRQITVNAIVKYLNAKLSVIEQLPDGIDTGDTGGIHIVFNILGKEIDCWGINRADDDEKKLLDIFASACKHLQPYGLSDKRNGDFVPCEWNIPNLFYCNEELEPILQYVGEQSFELYEHGTVQIKFDDSIYQLKVAHSTVDKIRAYIKAHQEIAENLDHCTNDFYKVKHHGFAIEDLAVVDYRYLSYYAERISAVNKLFIDVSRYLEPYGLTAKLEDNRVLCRWSIPYPGDEKVLLKCKGCGNISFTIYECGTVHLVRRYSDILAPYNSTDYRNPKEASVKTVFYLPQEIIAKLRSLILKHRNEIDMLASSQFNASNASDGWWKYNFMGAKLSQEDCDHDDDYKQLLFRIKSARICADICQVLKPYGFVAEQTTDSGFKTYWFDWEIVNIPNTLFLPPGNLIAEPAEDTAEV